MARLLAKRRAVKFGTSTANEVSSANLPPWVHQCDSIYAAELDTLAEDVEPQCASDSRLLVPNNVVHATEAEALIQTDD